MLVKWSNVDFCVFRYDICVPKCSIEQKLQTAMDFHPEGPLEDTQVILLYPMQHWKIRLKNNIHSHAVIVWFPDHKEMTMFFVLLETVQSKTSKNV